MSDKTINPDLDLPILGLDGSNDSLMKSLDTGMTVGEALHQAARWWTNKGRQLIKDQNMASDNPGFGRFTANPTTEEEAENSLPSNVLAGRAWENLTKSEKLRVVRFWHHHHVRVPNIDPELYLRAKQRPGVCFYCDEGAVCDEELPAGADDRKEIRELCWSHFMERYPNEAEARLKSGPVNDQ